MDIFPRDLYGCPNIDVLWQQAVIDLNMTAREKRIRKRFYTTANVRKEAISSTLQLIIWHKEKN